MTRPDALARAHAAFTEAVKKRGRILHLSEWEIFECVDDAARAYHAAMLEARATEPKYGCHCQDASDPANDCPVHGYTPDEQEAIRRYKAGERLCVSTGIDGGTTYGYGDLDQNGYWQFPLPDRAREERQPQDPRKDDKLAAAIGRVLTSGNAHQFLQITAIGGLYEAIESWARDTGISTKGRT